MVNTPSSTPVRTPVDALTKKIPTPPHTLQVPPAVVLLSVVVVPGQSVSVPVIGAGRPVTVTVANARQPVVAV